MPVEDVMEAKRLLLNYYFDDAKDLLNAIKNNTIKNTLIDIAEGNVDQDKRTLLGWLATGNNEQYTEHVILIYGFAGTILETIKHAQFVRNFSLLERTLEKIRLGEIL